MNLKTRVKNWSGLNIRRYLEVLLDRVSENKTPSEGTASHKAKFWNRDPLKGNKKAPFNSDLRWW